MNLAIARFSTTFFPFVVVVHAGTINSKLCHLGSKLEENLEESETAFPLQEICVCVCVHKRVHAHVFLERGIQF